MADVLHVLVRFCAPGARILATSVAALVNSGCVVCVPATGFWATVGARASNESEWDLGWEKTSAIVLCKGCRGASLLGCSGALRRVVCQRTMFVVW